MSTPSDKPLVSVVMSARNAAATLSRAMDSLLVQTYTALEIVVVNNGSTDATGELLAAYARQDARVRVVTNEQDRGLAAALNKGLAHATGEFVARMDADDVARPRRLERQVAFLRAHPEIAVCGAAICKRFSGRRVTAYFPSTHDEIRAQLLFHTGFAHPTVMWRRAAFERAGLRYDESWQTTEDYEFWSRALETLRGANLGDVLLDYYCHEGQVTAAGYHRSIQWTRAVHDRVVRRLLPDASQAEIDLHTRIAIPHDPFTAEELSLAENWLLKLTAANEQVGMYERNALRTAFASKWTAICDISAASVPDVRTRWAGSCLLHGARWSAQALKFRVKRLLGK